MLRLAPKYINFPKNRRKTAEIIEQVKIFCQCAIPQITGALNVTHISKVYSSKDGYIKLHCF